MAANENKYRPHERRAGIALCLSGGGFRATLFHLGALRRLNELGMLAEVNTFSTVSGGSILNGVLASRWTSLMQGNSNGVLADFDRLVAQPIRNFCKEDLRTSVLLWDHVNPINYTKLLRSDFSVTDLLARAYADSLSLNLRLDELPRAPRFVFCAANMETGVNWEFGRAADGECRMGDYLAGYVPTGEITIAKAVAASSAFPVTFPPLVLTFPDPGVFKGGHGDLDPKGLKSIPLTDGGVYDNLGLEPVWKSHRLVLVSDAGKPFDFKDDARQNVFERLSRSFDITSNQSGAIRKRWLISMFQASVMNGTYWGIGSDFEDYGLTGARGYGATVRELLTNVRTDLDAFSDGEIGCLENHGYALADVAGRRWLTSHVELRRADFSWPHPDLADDAVAETVLRQSDRRGVLADVWCSIKDHIRGLVS